MEVAYGYVIDVFFVFEIAAVLTIRRKEFIFSI